MKYTGEDLRIINVFETVTKAQIMDFYRYNDQLVFIVKEGMLWLALGRNRSNLDKLRKLYNTKVRIVEYSNNPEIFIKNLLFPIKPREIIIKDKEIVIKANYRDKALIYGREKKNLKALQEILERKGYKLRVE